MYKKLYSKITDALVSDGYIIIDDALDATLCENLLLLSKQKEDNFKNAGISSASDLHLDSSKRRDKIKWLSKENDVEKDFLVFSSNLQKYLNQELYLGLNYYEAHFAIYNKNDFYEKHLDCFKNFKNRVVTTVYYLDQCEGGELIIYDKKGDFLKKVIPTKNKLIIFMSEKFPHEVLQAKSKRYSIAGWFRVDKF